MRALVLLIAAGCYGPHVATGVPCGEGSACPEGLVCAAATQTCETTAGSDDAAVPDSDGNGDLDGDGVLDIKDNCPRDPNPTQADEDLDGVGNECDNCPTEPNTDQADTQELAANLTVDGVGDACDPNPARHDRIAVFEGFDGPLSNGWTLNNASVSGGRLRLNSGFARPPKKVTQGVAVTHFTVDTVAATVDYRSVEVNGPFDAQMGTTHGYRCGIFDNPMAVNSVRQSIQIYVTPYDVAGSQTYPGNIAPGLTGKLTITYDTAITCRGDTLGEDLVYSPAETISAPAGLRVQTLAAYFDYLIVYEPAP